MIPTIANIFNNKMSRRDSFAYFMQKNIVNVYNDIIINSEFGSDLKAVLSTKFD